MIKKLTMFFVCLILSAGLAYAQTNVTGSVVSSEDGEPVVGATVKVVGATNIGTVSDINGAFSLTVPKGKTELEISYVGMKTRVLRVASRMNVTLDPDDNVLDEVMVVAYGTTKKSSFTGSAAAIDGDKIVSRPVSNVTKALDGQVTGVLTTSGSGQPGSGSSIVIRGFGSINASNSPLYVVDGVPYGGSISAINPQDIEQMTVLKDASASALYGSRAANGVVIITTKKGKEGRPQVNFHNTVGWSYIGLGNYETVDQKEFVELTFESLRNDYQYGNGLSFADATRNAIANLGPTLGGNGNPEQWNPFKNYTWETLIDPITGKVKGDAVSAWDDKWYDEIYNKGALRHEHTLSVNGGTDRTSYLLSLGYLSEEGILKNTDFQRYSARTNVESQVTDWFKAGLNMNMAYNKSTYNPFDGSSTSNPWYTSQFMGPIYPVYLKDANGNNVYDADGNIQYDYGEGGRPVANDFNALGDLMLDRNFYDTDNASARTYMTFGSDNDNAGWAKGLKFNIVFGMDYQSLTETNIYNKYHGNGKNANGRVYKTATRSQTYTFGQQLMWNRKFGDHTFGLLAGHEFYQYIYKYLYAGKSNIVDGIDELRPAATITDADSYSQEHDIESWLGRINYNFADKYYLDASVRRDGSSRFYKDNRWGTFWSVGANWRITAEEFMKDLTWLNNLSLKVSYGESGNESIGSYYVWQNLYDLEFANGSRIGGFVSTLENKDLSWEKNGMLNIGLEGAMFKSRLRFGLEFFTKKTKDMLLNYPMALSTGFTGYAANVGNMKNTGIEAMISASLVKTKDVLWNLTLMGTHQSNKVEKLTSESPEIRNGYQIIKEGYDLTTFYLPKSAGVDPATGKQLYYVYESMDDNGNVTNESITSDYSAASAHRYFCGKRTPDIYGSISTDLQLFNCVDFSVLTTYSLGGKVFDSRYYSSMLNLYYGNTWNKNALRRWQHPGDVTDIPRIQVGGSEIQTSSYLIDASYFAIKNITLGYTLPAKWTNRIQVSKVRIYGSVDNLVTFTHLKGMDPQYNLSGNGNDYSYVPNKNFTIGLDINF